MECSASTAIGCRHGFSNIHKEEIRKKTQMLIDEAKCMEFFGDGLQTRNQRKCYKLLLCQLLMLSLFLPSRWQI